MASAYRAFLKVAKSNITNHRIRESFVSLVKHNIKQRTFRAGDEQLVEVLRSFYGKLNEYCRREKIEMIEQMTISKAAHVKQKGYLLRNLPKSLTDSQARLFSDLQIIQLVLINNLGLLYTKDPKHQFMGSVRRRRLKLIPNFEYPK